jgi:hypothetical protein
LAGRKSNSWNDFQKKTKGQFASRAENLAEYKRLKSGTSPWPKDYVPKLETMKVGERVNMAMGKTQPVYEPGGFATKDNIPDMQFVRDKLAVRTDWKTSVDNVQEYEVIKDVPVFNGPIGAQIDPTTGTYLLGGASQVEFRVPRDERINYLKPIGTPIKIK